MKKRTLVIPALVFAALLTSCSNKPEEVDYAVLEQTAAVKITQTYEARPTETSTNTPAPTETPEPTATAVPTEDPEEDLMIIRNVEPDDEYMISRQDSAVALPTATIVFPDKAQFVSALPSPNQFVPNQHFYLTWEIKNTGTTTWSGKYQFFYSDGIHLADQDSYAINQTVAPGESLLITMPATAPDTVGTYKTTWTLQNPDGIAFYYLYFVAIVGDKTYITDVPALQPTGTPSSLEWMCSDANRSLQQGDGCADYCTESVVNEMAANGLTCFAFGAEVNYAE